HALDLPGFRSAGTRQDTARNAGTRRAKSFSTPAGVDSCGRRRRPQVVEGSGDNAVDVVERLDVMAARIYANMTKSHAVAASSALAQAKTPSERNLALRLRFSSAEGRPSRRSSASLMFWPSKRAASSGSVWAPPSGS